MWKNFSLVLKAIVIVAIPVLIQCAGGRYLAHRAKAAKDVEVDKAYAQMRDGEGKPGMRGAQPLPREGADSTQTTFKLKPAPTDRYVTAPERPTMLMRYVGSEMTRDRRGSTSLMELPPGTTIMFLDGRLQVYHPPAKCNADE